METFRYITPAEHNRIQNSGALTPRESINRRAIYALPHNPLLWGLKDTNEVLDWIRAISGERAEFLIKFDIATTDPSADVYVQEGCVEPWFKMDKRRHITAYKPVDYEKPEILIWNPIPKEQITIVEFPKQLVVA